MALKPGTPCVVVTSGGLPVSEAPAGYGASFTPASNGFGVPVRIAGFGAPITFVGEDGTLWPGGVAPGGGGGTASLDFSDPNNSQYIPIL